MCVGVLFQHTQTILCPYFVFLKTALCLPVFPPVQRDTGKRQTAVSRTRWLQTPMAFGFSPPYFFVHTHLLVSGTPSYELLHWHFLAVDNLGQRYSVCSTVEVPV